MAYVPDSYVGGLGVKNGPPRAPAAQGFYGPCTSQARHTLHLWSGVVRSVPERRKSWPRRAGARPERIREARVLHDLRCHETPATGHECHGRDAGATAASFRRATIFPPPCGGHGATTIWEPWNGDTADPAMNSGNHLMLVGDLVTWFYENLAGIRPDRAQPAFKHIIMRPTPVGDLSCVKASYNSSYGKIVSDWRIARGHFIWNLIVPLMPPRRLTCRQKTRR